MQVPKEEVRKKILESALNEFEQHGFSGAQMRRIAEGANISTGNVYRYFENKDEVFDAIVHPVYTYISELIFDLYKSDECRDVKAIASDIAGNIMDVYRQFGRELGVIIDKSMGSKYENFTDMLVIMVAKRMRSELFDGTTCERDEIMSHVIASGFVQGIFSIMRTCTDPEQMNELINWMLIFYFDHIEARIR